MGINAEESNAIREYAYAKGEYRKIQGKLIGMTAKKRGLEKRLAETDAALAAIETLWAEAVERLNEAKKGMDKAVPNIPKDHVRAIVAVPKIHTEKWGDQSRELCAILLSAVTEPIAMKSIMERFANRFGFPLETGQDREALRELLGPKLRALARKGVIRRLPSENSWDMAYWVWVGLE